MQQGYLEIRGARVHNLQNVDLRLPHESLVVVTGVSGSGKSSLVFDIIYAEGRRRYVESLSAYARQFLERMEKPDVDDVLGIAPTVAIRQKNTTRNPRSTVATATEIFDFLRLLFARVGRTHCQECGERVTSDGTDAVTQAVQALEQGSRWYVLFPILEPDTEAGNGKPSPAGDPSRLKAKLFHLRERGFNRLFQDGRVFEFSTPESLLDIDFGREVFVLADRIVISPDIRERIADSTEIAYNECGEVRFQSAADPGRQLRFSGRFECSRCGLEHKKPEPRMFSFNTYYGACSRCEGLGQVAEYSMERIVSDRQRSLEEGAVKAWRNKYHKYQTQMLEAAARAGIPVDVPYRRLSAANRRYIEEGGKGYQGIRGFLKKLEGKSWKPHIAVLLSRWRERKTCPECLGSKLGSSALNVRVGGESIAGVMKLPLSSAREFFENLALEGAEAAIGAGPLAEVTSRLRFLDEVGLGYLTLDRGAATLSGGEAQRIQLASSLGSRLVGVCYVLDEPSIGLHSRDTARLIGILKQLRDLGNTVFVVEHDMEMMRAADYLVDLGPAAGEAGGKVVFSGTVPQIRSRNGSLTARYLLGEVAIPVPAKRRKSKKGLQIDFAGARKHNLKGIDFAIRLGLMTVITGVSGSGKSTLLHEIVHKWLAPERNESNPPADRLARVKGGGRIAKTILIGQGAIERTSRSVPVTYMRAFDTVRSLFAATPEASKRGLTPAYFSFNTHGGRCGTCAGSGKQTVDMQFLADVSLPCEDCNGKRYSPKALEYLYRGKSIWDVLEMTVDEGLRLFGDRPNIAKRLEVLRDVGLGYLRLGQPATQLSGGEAQRMKLALHIADSETERTLFLFDEPTTGLHFEDIRKLLGTCDRLIRDGATLMVVEHNLDIIKCADWVIDLGPEGGEGGGRIVAQGTPEEVAKCDGSHTGLYLREALA